MAWAASQDKHGRTRYDRGDGAVVKYDSDAACNTSRPWLPGHRGFMAFGPGSENNNYLLWRNRRGLSIPRKFKTPEAAMAAVDKEFPPKRSLK